MNRNTEIKKTNKEVRNISTGDLTIPPANVDEKYAGSVIDPEKKSDGKFRKKIIPRIEPRYNIIRINLIVFDLIFLKSLLKLKPKAKVKRIIRIA